jgi:hypothetical protein
MKFKVNIRLTDNNGVYEYFFDHKSYRVVNYKVENVIYNGVPDPTAILTLETDYKLISKVIADFDKICVVMNQVCIPLSSDEVDILIYSPSFNGQKQKYHDTTR